MIQHSWSVQEFSELSSHGVFASAWLCELCSCTDTANQEGCKTHTHARVSTHHATEFRHACVNEHPNSNQHTLTTTTTVIQLQCCHHSERIFSGNISAQVPVWMDVEACAQWLRRSTRETPNIEACAIWWHGHTRETL